MYQEAEDRNKSKPFLSTSNDSVPNTQSSTLNIPQSSANVNEATEASTSQIATTANVDTSTTNINQIEIPQSVPNRNRLIKSDLEYDNENHLQCVQEFGIKHLGEQKTNQILSIKPRPLQSTTNNGNQTSVPESNPTINSMPSFSKETRVTDTVFKSIANDAAQIAESLGKDVKRSQVLAGEWNGHIAKLDEHIKSIQNAKWKRTLIYGACIFTLGLGIYKMGMLRAIPDFLSTYIAPCFSSTVSTAKSSVPSEQLATSTLDKVMETPLTPLSIVTGVGIFTIGIGLLKVAVWILRKSPK